MSKKLFVTGFPHCGTTFFRTVLGNIEQVKNISRELIECPKEETFEYITYKWPFASKKLIDSKKGELIYFIIRNPVWVYSSLNRRKPGKQEKENAKLINYENTAKLFLETKEKDNNNIFTFKYEDLFDDNFALFKSILHQSKIEFNNDIFDSSKWVNLLHHKKLKLAKTKPNESDHLNFRQYQVNQEYRNMNDINKICLEKNQIEFILNSEVINKLYPNVKTLLS